MASLNKYKLVENIVNEISDNSTGQISPYDIRHNLLDIIDSVHLLTSGNPLNALNFSTPPTRTTKAGDFTLEKLGLEGYFSVDNSAFGFAALKSNYQGARNTSIGSESLSCNIYGDDNVALGFTALGGNTIGIGNIGIGSYSLLNQKSGNYNVAIGYGAGYYVDRNTSNKLIISSHANIDSQYMCDNPLGSGLTPLIYGDFQQLKLGIGVRSLGEGTLQVSGDIAPAPFGNLGTPSFPWQKTYTDSVILNNVSLSIDRTKPNSVFSSGNISPLYNNLFTLGASGYRWQTAWLNNIDIDGIAKINTVIAQQRCEYACKTISLATNRAASILDGGGPIDIFQYQFQNSQTETNCDILSDEDVEGAGFDISSSGIDYLRKYSFTFSKPDYSLTCLQDDNAYSRASWNSNISLHLSSGTHLKTDRVLFPTNIALVSSGCHGIFSLSNNLFISKENIIRGSMPSPVSSNGHLAGVGDVNFYSNSGELSNDYIFNVAAIESGISVKQRFLSGIKNRVKDSANDNKDKLSGFEIDYIDDSISSILGQKTDRLVIGSYDNSSKIIHGLTLMKKPLDDGIFGITNLPLAKNITPETAINVRAVGHSIIRMTAENSSNTKAAIQLLGKSNCEENGLELCYYTASGISDLSMIKDASKSTNVRFFPETTTSNPKVSFFPDFNDTSGNSMINIGSARYPYASVRMFEYINDKGSTNPTKSVSGCVLYIKPKVATYQSHSVYAIDASGYIHDLVVNKFDSNDARALYTDVYGNTYGGKGCIKTRGLPIPRNNTIIGFNAGRETLSSSGNTIVGCNAGVNLLSSNRNILIGHNVASGQFNLHNNIVIGNSCFNNTPDNINNNIIIGNDGLGNGLTSNYNFLVGSSSNVILMHGILGPNNSNKKLTLPSGGNLFINDASDTESLSIRTNVIETIDYGGSDYPENELLFNFKANLDATLFKLNHSAPPLSNDPSYFIPNPLRPYAELNGDFRLKGDIRFNDGTSLNSSNFLTDIDILETGLFATSGRIDSLSNEVSSLIVEGFVPAEIKPPSSSSMPSTGILSVKNKNWNNVMNVTLYNRDVTSTIHAGAYVIAIRVNEEYKPIWISANDTSCECC